MNREQEAIDSRQLPQGKIQVRERDGSIPIRDWPYRLVPLIRNGNGSKYDPAIEARKHGSAHR